MSELRDLENETAEVLLNAIQEEAPKMGSSGLLELAQAYAAVVGAAPGPERKPRGAVLG
jgi:hypothetical protein